MKKDRIWDPPISWLASWMFLIALPTFFLNYILVKSNNFSLLFCLIWGVIFRTFFKYISQWSTNIYIFLYINYSKNNIYIKVVLENVVQATLFHFWNAWMDIGSLVYLWKRFILYTVKTLQINNKKILLINFWCLTRPEALF